MMIAHVSPSVTAADFGLSPTLAFAILGLLVNRVVDFARNGLDKTDRIPKAIWLLIAWGIGIVVAFVVSASNSLQAFFGLEALDKNTVLTAVLFGMGFGSIGGFWHEVMSWFSGAPAPTPKGFKPNPK